MNCATSRSRVCFYAALIRRLVTEDQRMRLASSTALSITATMDKKRDMPVREEVFSGVMVIVHWRCSVGYQLISRSRKTFPTSVLCRLPRSLASATANDVACDRAMFAAHLRSAGGLQVITFF
jgi:hypothetical protein